jgi:hypothetical protein
MKTTRLIAVRYLPATNTKGSRLKVFICGSEPQTFGYHSFDGGAASATEEAAKAAFAKAYPKAKCPQIIPCANPYADTMPNGGGDCFYAMQSLEA